MQAGAVGRGRGSIDIRVATQYRCLMSTDAAALPAARRPLGRMLVTVLSLGLLAAVGVACEVAAYRWRALVDSAYCGLGCPPVHYRDQSWLSLTHMGPTGTYDVVVMVARQCVVIALAILAAALIAPALAGHTTRAHRTQDPRRRRFAAMTVAAALLLAGVAGGVASALLQLPIPGDGVSHQVIGLNVGWPWYWSSNLLLAVEAMLAVALSVSVVGRRHRARAGSLTG
jgi:hypothetical protein